MVSKHATADLDPTGRAKDVVRLRNFVAGMPVPTWHDTVARGVSRDPVRLTLPKLLHVMVLGLSLYLYIFIYTYIYIYL